jgi:iron complex outermembrane receptor protein
MMETVLSRSVRLICLGGMTLGMHAAYAQEQSAPMQRVEVTGSRIRQVDLETAQPIQVMTQEQIQKNGLITVGDILNKLSSAGSPNFSKGESLGSDRESGGQYINLRNLGANRVLVLVDGKRWTASVNGYTDLSTVPAVLIERIEVLKDGASSIYGSDAVAGVVNIILKKSLQGGQLSLYTGQNQKTDGKNRDFSLAYGANSDKSSLMFSLSHTEQGAVWPSTRGITATPKGPAHPTAGLGTGPWGKIEPLDASWTRVLNHTGDQYGGGVGAVSRDPANYHDASATNAADKYNSAQQMMFQMPNKLDTVFTKGTFELPANMKFTTTAMYSQRNSTAQIAGTPLISDVQPTFPVYIDKDNYFNPYGNQVAGAGNGQDLYFYRRTVEVPRVTDNESRTVHIDATLQGDFELRGLPWNWSVGYNHSAVSGSVTSTGNLNLLNLKKAVGPSFMNAKGVIQCGTPGSPIAAAECVPFDLLGGPSASTPAALNYVMSTGQASYGSTVNSATADISGELYTLPAGALAFAAGLEHRNVRGYDMPGQFEQSGYSSDLAGNPTHGEYSVREAYLELNIPVLKGKRWAELLSFDLATRHSDYSNFGTTNNSKFSFMWKPVKDLLTRGTYAQGFRAPTVGDTFGGGSQSYDDYMDPCDSAFGEAGRNPLVASRCATAGAGAGFRQVDQTGQAVTSSSGGQSSTPFMSGAGNSKLRPESATTKTLGFVYSPSFIPGLSGSIDWYSIKVTNQIKALTATDVAEMCYIQGLPGYCGAIGRDAATGQITTLAHGNVNQGALQTEGIDLSLNYRLPRTRYGQFGLRSDTTYVDSYREKASADAAWKDKAGEYFYNRVKSNIMVDWNLSNWSATWTARYYSGVKDKCYTSSVECSNPGGAATWGTNYNKLGAMVYNDISAGYKTSWKGQILVGINNVFNKQPRVTYLGAASSSVVDANLPIDRFFYARYNQSF